MTKRLTEVLSVGLVRFILARHKMIRNKYMKTTLIFGNFLAAQKMRFGSSPNVETFKPKLYKYERGREMVEIRKAVAADAEKILNYCKVVGAESDNLTFGAEGVSITIEKEREYLESILHSNKQLYLVAVDNNEIVGTAVFSSFVKARLAHRAEISISVKKSMWGRHIGTRFMEQLVDFAKNVAKTEIISLEVRSDNERAIALYEKFGFQKVGRFDGFMKIDGNYVSCDIMALSLTENICRGEIR